MEYYFATDDKLERSKYAEFLNSMLENCDMYRREDSDGAYVIAIDSPWGTGKTRFAKMLRNSLEGREPRVIDGKADQSFIPPAKEDRKFNVIYYNSWETDYWNDAIEPLMDSILNSEAFTQFRKDKKNKEAWDNLFRFAKGVLKASGYALASKAFGETSVGIFKEGLSESKKKAKDPLETFKKKSENYIEFRKALELVIDKTDKKLVIIVDELDRCRPTFAIQTLELAKHLFAVKGLIFIFALDVKQLSCSAETVYGQNMDATGYLCRFFDYYIKPTNYNSRLFIESLYNSINYKKDNQLVYLKDRSDVPKERMIDFISQLAINADLSLRDLSTLLKYFHIMIASFLNKYTQFRAFQIYFTLLLLKLKYSNFFTDVISEKSLNITTGQDLRAHVKSEIGFRPDDFLIGIINALNSKTLLGKKTHNIYIGETEERNGTSIIQIQDISTTSDRMIRVIWKNSSDDQRYSTNYTDSVNLDRYLFFEDLLQWERIQKMTLSSYLSTQLEMFDFTVESIGDDL